MTYNFDADAWYERELESLRYQRDSGRINAEEFDRQLQELDKRYDEMVAGFDADGAYCVK